MSYLLWSAREKVTRQDCRRDPPKLVSTPTLPRVLLAGLMLMFLVMGSRANGLNGQQAEQAPFVSAPQLLTQSISAMSGGVQLTDVTLTGTVDSYTASGHESGTITLRATASGAARVDLQLPSGSTSEMVGIANSQPYGNRQGQDGKLHPISLHNLLVDPAWFAPVMSLTNMNLAAQKEASVILLPSGNSDPGGTSHLRFSAVPFGKADIVGKEIFRLSREEIFINTTTFLPSEIRFNSHPEQNSMINRHVRIEYLRYTSSNGMLLPSHIRKTVASDARNSLDGTTTLDIVITSISINSSITDSSLQLQ